MILLSTPPLFSLVNTFKFDENRPKFKRRLIALYVCKDSTIGYINKKEKNIVTGDFIKNHFVFIR
jgi:hypothetical protein